MAICHGTPRDVAWCAQGLLAMAYHVIFVEKRTDVCVTYVAPNQELVKRTIAEFRGCFDDEHEKCAA